MVRTTSVGRLFDGVASLLGVRLEVAYEAQAAIELEHLARRADRVHAADASRSTTVSCGSARWSMTWSPRSATAWTRAALALGFHQALADATALLAAQRPRELETTLVGLTGGVFQNKLFVSRTAQALRRAGLQVLTHRVVPANDGGLASVRPWWAGPLRAAPQPTDDSQAGGR